MTAAGGWRPIEEAPKDGRDFLAVREGFLVWERPDEAGFLSGCDMGPDVFEENFAPEVVMVNWCQDGFVDDQGQQYVECGIENRMYDPETLDAPDSDGNRPLRLTCWQSTPALPPPPENPHDTD